MKLEFTRFGLKQNPVGKFVSCKIREREYLGEVIGCEYEQVRGCFELTVKHFNGELWSFKPCASAVEVIQ